MMTDPFADLVADARAFLSELAAQNSRAWFDAEKPRYEARLKTPAILLMEKVAADIRRDCGVVLRPKLFRPQRDVRFSQDKTPYHTHLHLSWSGDGKGMTRPALFFGIAPEYVTLGGGVMGFDRAALARWRAALDGQEGGEIAGELARLAALGLAPGEPELKRVPAPFGKDHPHGGLLRRKGLTLWREMEPGEWARPAAALRDGFAALLPLLQRLERLS